MKALNSAQKAKLVQHIKNKELELTCQAIRNEADKLGLYNHASLSGSKLIGGLDSQLRTHQQGGQHASEYIHGNDVGSWESARVVI
ncbi:hypothetical protein VE01_04841 [Pseudogymnoascus verrucosus]|uniref:Uncharacterized protein n=1 Tax=Pseudogymnoascus verrucosus TaxID=342668 RepID=A0A1B8GMQ4_9PEZI|nr:uncharacterized protein VE01_04841 [Pseudogymnoascus verrucosus]OBT97109.1 hypothetical protein VE01_04841 [Pseudogymnoascus verrucosus]